MRHMGTRLKLFFIACGWLFSLATAFGQPLNIAAASSMRFVLPTIIEQYQQQHPEVQVRVVYGSSGRLYGQLSHGAPFHVFMSANMAYAEQAIADEQAIGQVQPYAEGRLVFWWQGEGFGENSETILANFLATPNARMAIANPQHAPYGVQSLAWLQQQSAWEAIEPRLVYTESVAQVAHFVRSGAANLGILALALAVTDELATVGQYAPVPAQEYAPLRKGMVLTKAGTQHPYASGFMRFMQTAKVQQVLAQGGFAPASTSP